MATTRERKDRTVRIPEEMMREAEDLVPAMAAAPKYRWASVNATSVLRRALQMGLDALREELGAAPSAGDDEEG